jgi:hypothetical protein
MFSLLTIQIKTRIMQNSSPKELKQFIENNVIKNAKKIRGKHSPLAEFVDKTQYTLPVKFIYDLSENLKHFYLIGTKNYSKDPKRRYFLGISLANNSSDLLVQFARDFAIKNELKLIQYSLYPDTFRVHLLTLYEIQNSRNYNASVELLKASRKEFRDILVRFKNIVENE